MSNAAVEIQSQCIEVVDCITRAGSDTPSIGYVSLDEILVLGSKRLKIDTLDDTNRGCYSVLRILKSLLLARRTVQKVEEL